MDYLIDVPFALYVMEQEGKLDTRHSKINKLIDIMNNRSGYVDINDVVYEVGLNYLSQSEYNYILNHIID